MTGGRNDGPVASLPLAMTDDAPEKTALGSRLDQHQKATMAARARAEAKLRASLS